MNRQVRKFQIKVHGNHDRKVIAVTMQLSSCFQSFNLLFDIIVFNKLKKCNKK